MGQGGKMQTFFPFQNVNKTVQCLDNRRLGKQRVEAIQILNILLGYSTSSSWVNHPAVKMWRSYEPYLVKVYLRKIMDEWIKRGYKNEKCEKHWMKFILHEKIRGKNSIKPSWINNDFCKSHKSNLVRKLPEHYKKFFPEVSDNLEYIWPIGGKNGKKETKGERK